MTNTHILVTGGAGYIGQAVVEKLVEREFTVTVVDRKSSPFIKQLQKQGDIFFHQMDYGSIANEATLAEHLAIPSVLSDIDYIIHLAASHQVSESCEQASDYYDNNVIKFKGLLDKAVELDVDGVIFSGSSSVYGDNSKMNTDEDTLFDPTSPYASTKAIGEYMLKDYNMAHGLPYISLRYFNAAGADPELKYGYSQDTPTHLVPCLVGSIVEGREFYINGTDYPTPDGTVIRSYTHVTDIAEAHVLAIDYMMNNPGTAERFNIGHSEAHSVRQVTDAAKELFPEFKVVERERRPGDSTMQSADNSKSRSTLGWKTVYTIKDMLTHEYEYQLKQRKQNG